MLVLFPFLTFKPIIWLLEQSKIFKAAFWLTSKPINWLLLHPKTLKAVFWLTSKFVSWLFAQLSEAKAAKSSIPVRSAIFWFGICNDVTVLIFALNT